MAQDNKQDNTVKQNLAPEEEKELEQGRALYEMDNNNPGWQIVKEWLKNIAFHSWVDPRSTKSKEEWEWQELNAFHAANNAKEMLEEITRLISHSEYLDKVKRGEIERKKMKI